VPSGDQRLHLRSRPSYRKVHRAAVSRRGVQHSKACEEAQITPEFGTKKERDKDADGEKEDKEVGPVMTAKQFSSILFR
jgi:hypothetical protein